MPLTFVSLTGADDKVKPAALAALSARYAKAVPPEWAILYCHEKEGTARYPSLAWRESFLELSLPFTAAHLCGPQVFRDILDPATAQPLIADLSRYGRVQLNINARRPEFTEEEVLVVYRTLHQAGLHLILQHHDNSRRPIEKFLSTLDAASLSRIDLLHDESKGTGTAPEQWPPISTVGPVPLRCGYAGGLGPAVLEEELPRINESATAWRDWPYFIDMESGIRTENEFDLAKVEAVLEFVATNKGSGGIYFASKVVHAHRWQALRAAGVKTASSWIDEAGEGETADYAELSERCLREIKDASRLVLYCESHEILKGAILEAGAALMAEIPVFLVGECASLSRVFRGHRLWHECASIEDAISIPARHQQ